MGRIIGYGFENCEFDEGAMDKLLARAKSRNVVTEYDTGRGYCVWFNGRPGPELRALREEVRKLAGGTPWRRR